MSTEAILDAIGAIYNAALDSDSWPAVLERVSDLIGGVPTMVAFRDQGGAFPPFHCARRSTEAFKLDADYFHALDPMMAAMRTAPAGADTDQSVLPQREPKRGEFYNDYARRFGMGTSLQAFAFRGADWLGLVAANRSAQRGEFGPEQRAIIGMLLPHLTRAMRLHAELRAARSRADSTTAALDRLPQAAFLVEAGSRIVFANRAAEVLIAGADGISADANGLRASTPAQTASLRRLIARSAGAAPASGGPLQLDRPSGARALSAMVAPLRPAAPPDWIPALRPTTLVLITDLDRSEAGRTPDRLRALFGLTPSEAALALSIAKGTGLKATARSLGIAPSTARTHLSRVFAKTNTARQAELASLLAGLAESPTA